MTVEEFTCETHRAIASAIIVDAGEVEQLRRENELCRRAFETDDLLRIPEVGDLNALQIVRKLAELSDRLAARDATPPDVTERARRAAGRIANLISAENDIEERLCAIIAAEFERGEN
jgi:hypothetical protein